MNRISRRIPPVAWAIIAIFLGMVSVQCGAAVAKYLFTVTGPMGMTALRTTFAAIMLGAIWRPWRGGALKGRKLATFAGYGVSLGFMNLLFYLSLERLPLGLAVAIEFLGPFTLAIAFSRKPMDFVWIALAMAGMAGLFPFGSLSARIDLVGVAYALGAGVCWAVYIIFGQKAGALLPGGQASALGMAIAAMATLPVGLWVEGTNLLSPTVLGFGLVVAFLSSALPYPLDMVALKRLPTRTFGILVSLEPAIAAISGLLLLGESLSLRQWAAILAVVLASLGSTVGAARGQAGKTAAQPLPDSP